MYVLYTMVVAVLVHFSAVLYTCSLYTVSRRYFDYWLLSQSESMTDYWLLITAGMVDHGHERSGLSFALDELTSWERPSAAGLHAYALLMQANGRYWHYRCVIVKTFKTAGCSNRRGCRSHGDTSYVWAVARISERSEHLTLIKYVAADASISMPTSPSSLHC